MQLQKNDYVYCTQITSITKIHKDTRKSFLCCDILQNKYHWI